MEETEKLKKEIIRNIPKQFSRNVLLAIQYASKYHNNTLRYDSKPLIQHLLHVAMATTQLNLDTNSTIASILHEIPLEKEEERYILNNFGKEVLNILRRIEDIKQSTTTKETDPEIIIKYILSSSNDLRAVIIKILDTLEDMKSIENVPEEFRKDSLSKALNIYSPLAEYLNLDSIKKEIDENAFREHLSTEYGSITKKMKELKIDAKTLSKYQDAIWEEIRNLPFKKDIKGRIKSKYSIYNKLKKYEKEWVNPNINSIDDLIAFRIITLKEDDCFFVLEKLMDKGEMLYERFDDYISNPKPNGYRAIQFPIKFSSISELIIEIQILTEDMYYHNTYGPASHIAYKASKSRYAKPSNNFDWVEKIHKQLKQSKNERRNKINIPIQCNIFKDEVFAFTPKGKIIALDRGDTALDFAFKLHTDIANKAVSAIVNDKVSKLSTILNTGDNVEIKTDKSKICQKIEALKYVNSMSSKFRIRNQLSKNKLK